MAVIVRYWCVICKMYFDDYETCSKSGRDFPPNPFPEGRVVRQKSTGGVGVVKHNVIASEGLHEHVRTFQVEFRKDPSREDAKRYSDGGPRWVRVFRITKDTDLESLDLESLGAQA